MWIRNIRFQRRFRYVFELSKEEESEVGIAWTKSKNENQNRHTKNGRNEFWIEVEVEKSVRKKSKSFIYVWCGFDPCPSILNRQSHIKFYFIPFPDHRAMNSIPIESALQLQYSNYYILYKRIEMTRNEDQSKIINQSINVSFCILNIFFCFEIKNGPTFSFYFYYITCDQSLKASQVESSWVWIEQKKT